MTNLLMSLFIGFGCAAKIQSSNTGTTAASPAQPDPQPEPPQTEAGMPPQSQPLVQPPSDKSTSLQDQVIEYRQRYGLRDVYSKLVDNHGDNYENLYGVRNFRVVLHGVYYRGGANNVYNKVDGIRSNTNPLPASGLKHLCEQGFENAIYLYSTNYSTAAPVQSCKNLKNEPATMKYDQITGLNSANTEKFISRVYDVIKRKTRGPIYGHCWNGWHASGFVASALLKQFCGYSDQQALDYWMKNTDGNNGSTYDSVKKMVVNFKPLTKYQITSDEKSLICP